MFACCVAGRLLQTNLQQIDETHALFEIPAAEKVNHLCVFLLGTVPFPEGYGATVHFFWPGKGSQVLGMLSNEKPSAIFRLRSTFSSLSNPPSGMTTPSAFTYDATTSASASTSASDPTGQVTAILGFAVEPLETVAAQIAALNATTTNAGAGGMPGAGTLMKSSSSSSSASPWTTMDASALAERIAKHLFNYVSGFVPSGSGGLGVGLESVVPMSVVARWYESFVNKIRVSGTTFLEREE